MMTKVTKTRPAPFLASGGRQTSFDKRGGSADPAIWRMDSYTLEIYDRGHCPHFSYAQECHSMSTRTKFWSFCLFIVAGALALAALGAESNRASAATPEATAEATMAMDGMSGMEMKYSSNDFVPAALAYYDGEEVYFIHPEASDAGVADVLTAMMGPRVLTVPALANVPEEMLGNVFVFTNGIEGMGPLGFQPDVFDSIPDQDAYSPLRAINLVTWKDGAAPSELRSVAEIIAAEEDGLLELSLPGVVVNMPILVWPGGTR
jgi:hypothetical protein